MVARLSCRDLAQERRAHLAQRAHEFLALALQRRGGGRGGGGILLRRRLVRL